MGYFGRNYADEMYSTDFHGYDSVTESNFNLFNNVIDDSNDIYHYNHKNDVWEKAINPDIDIKYVSANIINNKISIFLELNSEDGKIQGKNFGYYVNFYCIEDHHGHLMNITYRSSFVEGKPNCNAYTPWGKEEVDCYRKRLGIDYESENKIELIISPIHEVYEIKIINVSAEYFYQWREFEDDWSIDIFPENVMKKTILVNSNFDKKCNTIGLGLDCFKSIISAIEDFNKGEKDIEKIIVCDGCYSGDILIEKGDITISGVIGSESSLPLITGDGTRDSVIDISADNVNLENFYIKALNETFGCVKINQKSKITIYNCEFSSAEFIDVPEEINRAGVYVDYSKDVTILNCIIRPANNLLYGIYLKDSKMCRVIDCVILEAAHTGIKMVDCDQDFTEETIINSEITSCGFYGLWIADCSKNKIRDNKIVNNDWCGIYMEGGNNNKITDCTISKNKVGMWLMTTQKNEIVKCDITDNDWGGVVILSSHQNGFQFCNIFNNTYSAILNAFGYSNFAAVCYWGHFSGPSGTFRLPFRSGSPIHYILFLARVFTIFKSWSYIDKDVSWTYILPPLLRSVM